MNDVYITDGQIHGQRDVSVEILFLMCGLDTTYILMSNKSGFWLYVTAKENEIKSRTKEANLSL